MIEQIKPLDASAPGSFAELLRAQRLAESGDTLALLRHIFEHSGLDADAAIAQLAIADVPRVIERYLSGVDAHPLGRAQSPSSA